MNYLVTAEDVMTRMGLPDVEGVEATINSALDAAHVRFEGLIQTTFAGGSKTDLFFLEEGRFPVVENGYAKLRLRHAFINPQGTVLVRAYKEITGTPTVLGGIQYRVDHQKGIVHVAEEFMGWHVEVTYLAGFHPTQNPVPSWLKEGILAYVPYVLNTQQPTNRSSEQEGSSKKIADMSGEIVAPYMRGYAFHYRPMF